MTPSTEGLERDGLAPSLSPWADWKDPVRWFMRTLCAGDGGFVELRLRDPYTDTFVSQFFPASKPNRILHFIDEERERGDVFIGMCIRGRMSGTAADVIRGNFYWADLDNGEEGLDRVPIRPNLVQDSGSPGHCHAFWALAEPADLTDLEERADFELRLKAIQRACRSDSVADLPRIMRPPNSLNWKDPESPTLVAPVDFNP